MVIKKCNTLEQYKILTWLSTELNISEFALSLEERNIIKVTDKTSSEMLVTYKNGEFKTEIIK